MRRLIVRRFESSIYAFQSTLDSIIKSSEIIRDWYERVGKVPMYRYIKKGNYLMWMLFWKLQEKT